MEMHKPDVIAAGAHPVLRVATWFTALTITAVMIYLVARLFAGSDPRSALHTIAQTLSRLKGLGLVENDRGQGWRKHRSVDQLPHAGKNRSNGHAR